jgi:hypothetical protein
MISRTSKLLEIYDFSTITFSKMAYPDNPEVASSYSFSNLLSESASFEIL